MAESSEVLAEVSEVDPGELAEGLASSSRRVRQSTAAQVAALSRTNPELVLTFGDVVVDSLSRPEARTRWESLDALSNLVALDNKLCATAVELAEEALFDEDNGTVRLASMRFICKLGASSKELASETWPLIDEALRCYHGDPEYTDMLVAVNEFASGELSEDVVEQLVKRMEFDANNPKSGLLRRANSIIAAARGESAE